MDFRPIPTLRDWGDLLALVLRARVRCTLGRLGLISVERQITLIEADIPELARLRAAVGGRETNRGAVA